MTPESKKTLSATIRALRERLLTDLHAAMDSEYLLSVRAQNAGLGEAAARKRRRLEDWLDEQVEAEGGGAGSAGGKSTAKKKAKKKTTGTAKARKLATAAGGKRGRTRDDFRREVEQQAAYTLLNRLILLRLMEASGLRGEKVVTGGWESAGYRTFRELAPAVCRAPGDTSEGYAFLLELVFEELAQDLPGLFDAAAAGVGGLVPVPASTLRHVVEALDRPELASCWEDDMTLGWVYQYWNDPEREALDAKLNARQKLESHEIASKTQMFTERYMVDWLLQNSLGPMWLAICARNRWTPEVEKNGVLAALEARRAEWRGERERGEVSLTELMPLHSEAERRWAYYVPQPLPADATKQAPASIRELKLLDPAVGSGHFLVVAFDLLFALYQEEARHRRADPEADKSWSRQRIAEQILENNLFGIDIDPRAVQIAAAALWLKARQTCAEARPQRLGLVASNLRLAGLAEDHPALAELRAEVELETGIPAKLTNTVLKALAGADHLGSLLQVDRAVEKALDEHEQALSRVRKGIQGGLFDAGFGPEQRELIAPEEARATILERLESFLQQHTRGDDLGLRLRGEQLAAGVRFVRMIAEGTYDLVVGNPPYQGTSKMADARYVQAAYPKGKADLYAAFLERGLQLVRPGGVSALLTMRNWMFIKQYAELRQWLLAEYDLRALGDLSSGAFDEISAAQVVVSVTMSVFWRCPPRVDGESVALRLFDDETVTHVGETLRKRAAVLAHVGRVAFDAEGLGVVPGSPVVYWWSHDLRERYAASTKVREHCAVRAGLTTGDNPRFVRCIWESAKTTVMVSLYPHFVRWNRAFTWVPYIKGPDGQVWIDAPSRILRWTAGGLEKQVVYESRGTKGGGNGTPSAIRYFTLGVAVTPIGSEFSVRCHRVSSIFSNMGTSLFPPKVSDVVCALNSSASREVMSSLNPSMHFEAGDVNRLPLFPIANADEIFDTVETAFTEHESHREPSVEFRRPGPSPWRHAQAWAQLAVDRPENAPLPDYAPERDPEPAVDHLSYALGVALGRFGPAGEGILDPHADDPATRALVAAALPGGILFLDTTLDPQDPRDSLGHPGAAPLLAAWEAHGAAIAPGGDLRSYLTAAGAKGFFEVHRKMYESRPIHWPLASESRTFVAWVTIHRWDAQTLRVLLADHLQPTQTRLDGELADLRAARDGDDKKAARAAEKRLANALKGRDELAAFIATVEQCAEKGPPSGAGKATTKAKGRGKAPAKAEHAGQQEREVDARYDPDLDDGVMINSAALWPLIHPFWKQPQKWWRELAASAGKKDYDWAHLAMRYWPTRVDAKCQRDPSLAVAHGCFWKYHPKRAWAWELRLQHEIGPEFRIDEAPYRGDGGSEAHRTVFIADFPDDALEIVQREALRRIRKEKKKGPIAELCLLEAGLWSARPGECWALEDTIIEKQEADFRLLAPDEPETRAALLKEMPKLMTKRSNLLEGLCPTNILLGDEDDDESDDESDDDELEGEEDEA